MRYYAVLMTIMLFGFKLVSMSQGAGPVRDRGIFVEETNAYKARLEAQAGQGGKGASPARRVLRPDLTGMDRPRSPDEFLRIPHQPLICQGLTGQCWAFAATSFFESEVQRLSGRKTRLSDMWTSYWEFVEKARGFVRKRGDSYFPRGSEPNAALRIWERYGVVPAEAYSALPAGRPFYDDRKVYAEMNAYLKSVKDRGKWDESEALAGVRAILDRHLGAPPEAVEVDGTRVTPQEYCRRVLGMDVGNYVSVMSLMQEPWHEWARLPVPDNWWGSRAYYNVPLDEFVHLVRDAVRGGVSVCLVLDSSEPGFYFREDVAFVPSFDIPREFIDDSARQMRFSNESTTDDHVVHIVGYQERNGEYWYLIKDSGNQPRNGHFGGYMFYREDYIRLKGLALVLPRKVVEHVLGRELGAMQQDRLGDEN